MFMFWKLIWEKMRNFREITNAKKLGKQNANILRKQIRERNFVSQLIVAAAQLAVFVVFFSQNFEKTI